MTVAVVDPCVATGEGMEEGTGMGIADETEDIRPDRDFAGEESAGEAKMDVVDEDVGGGTGAGDDPDIPTTPPATTCTTLLIIPPLDTGIPGTISAPNICIFSAGTTWMTFPVWTIIEEGVGVADGSCGSTCTG